MLDLHAWHNRFKQQASWTSDLRQYLLSRAAIDSTTVSLDIGCGTGALFDQFENAPNLHGLDIDHKRLSYANAILDEVNLTTGDIYRLPYSEQTFDLVYGHFLFVWLEKQADAISEILRVTRPGGWVMAMAEPDYTGRIDHPENLARLGSLQTAALESQGADIACGRKIAGIFHEAGLSNIESGVLQGHWQKRPSKQDWELEWMMLESDLEGSIQKKDLDKIKSNDWHAWQKGERVLFIPTFYTIGQKQ